MAGTTISVGGLLILVGLVGYVQSGMASVTALIPAFFGIVLLLLGLVARQEKRRALAMHIAVALALVGCLATFRGVLQLPALLGGGTVGRPLAVASQSATFFLLLFLLVRFVRSFIAARRAA
ncbi:MAG TPA: hypothetical protein RMF84_05435 [Polyangiaceae bacterium LLY-WYZ-14_1]|nr:hypothetical protein [Polyangiaceae bacterium LLY-WYZ-14_1]